MTMKKILVLLMGLLTISSLLAQKDSGEWYIYKNVAYNFSIKYPDFCYEIDTSGPVTTELKQRYREGRGGLSFWLDKKQFTANFGNQSVPIFSVTIFNNNDKIDLKSFIYKVINQHPGFYDKEELAYHNIELNNYPAQKVIYQNKAGGYDGINKDVFIEKDTLVYAIMIINPPQGDYDEFLEKILTSFKFLN